MSRPRVLVAILVPAALGGCQLADDGIGRTSADLAGPAIDLIAIGQISGDRADRSHATAGALENGVAGNLLGGVGSGIAYAGGNTFVAVPDRGPNAVAYNPAVDDTASYIDRIQTFYMALDRAAPGAALPFELTPVLLDTTLLHSARPLHYDRGAAWGCTPVSPRSTPRATPTTSPDGPTTSIPRRCRPTATTRGSTPRACGCRATAATSTSRTSTAPTSTSSTG